MNPKVSIIIPFYNVEKYLKDCLESVRNQTLQEWECICVDDGSTDRSYEIAEEYVKKDSRFQLFHQENKGQAAARNSGFDYSRGEFVYFLDSDDYMVEETLDISYRKAIEEGLELVLFDDAIVFENELLKKKYKDVFVRRGTYEICTGKEMYREMVQNDDYTVHPSMFLVKRAYMQENNIRFIEGMIYEDNPFMLDCLTKASRVGHINRNLFVRRIRGNSTITQKLTLYHFCSAIRAYVAEMTYIAAQDREYQDSVARRLNSLWRIADNAYIQTQEVSPTLDEVKMLNGLSKLEKSLMASMDFGFPTRWAFADNRIKRDSKIVLYGAGNVGQDYYDILTNHYGCDNICWVDKQYEDYQKLGFSVDSPQRIKEYEYDYLVLAIGKKRVVDKVLMYLKELKVPEEKIIWNEPQTEYIIWSEWHERKSLEDNMENINTMVKKTKAERRNLYREQSRFYR